MSHFACARRSPRSYGLMDLTCASVFTTEVGNGKTASVASEVVVDMMTSALAVSASGGRVIRLEFASEMSVRHERAAVNQSHTEMRPKIRQMGRVAFAPTCVGRLARRDGILIKAIPQRIDCARLRRQDPAVAIPISATKVEGSGTAMLSALSDATP